MRKQGAPAGFAKAMHDAHTAFQRGSAPIGVDAEMQRIRKGIHQQPARKSLLWYWHSQSLAYRQLICEHGKLFIDVCHGCKRDIKQARANAVASFAQKR